MADFILILVLVLFALDGWKKGFIRTLLNLSSTVISLVFGIILYNPISKLLRESSLGDFVEENVYEFLLKSGEELLKTDIAVKTASSIVVNTISFIMVIILAKIFITILSKVLNIAARFPVIKQANKVLGVIVGIFSGLIVCYIAVGVIKNLSSNEIISQINESIESSSLAIKFYEGNFVADILAKIMK